MSRYWEAEKPITIKTSKNTIEYYPQAGKLSVAKAPWIDDNGAERQGKTIAFDITALLESNALKEAQKIFKEILQLIEQRVNL